MKGLSSGNHPLHCSQACHNKPARGLEVDWRWKDWLMGTSQERLVICKTRHQGNWPSLHNNCGEMPRVQPCAVPGYKANCLQSRGQNSRSAAVFLPRASNLFFLIKKKTMGSEHMGKTDLLLLQKLLLVWTDKEKTRYS